MAAITTGTGLGLFNTSANLLGGSYAGGNALIGKSGQSDTVYVNASSGNLIVQRADEYLASRGLDLGLVRTYNAQGQIDGDNNDGWRIGIYRSLKNLPSQVNTAGSTITKVYGDGHEAVFTYDPGRSLYVSTDGDGAHDTLSYNSTTQQWTWTDGTPSTLEAYNSAGQLVSSRDADGNLTSYTYTGSIITRIATASGESVYLDYDYTGTKLEKLRTVTATGTETLVRYGYDSLNRLTTVTVDLSPLDNAVSDGQTYVTTYTYDGDSTRIASITNGDTTTVSFTYQQVNGVYRVFSQVDGNGRTTVFNYDTANRQTYVIHVASLHVSAYGYDTKNRLTRVTDATGNPTSYAYDDATGDLRSVTDALGHTLTMEYDSRGNLTLKRDAAGNTVKYTYDTSNRLVTETTYLVPDADGDGAGQPGNPLTTRYVYNDAGHLLFAVSAEGHVTQHRYDDAFGNRTATITYAGATYNLAGLDPADALGVASLNSWVAAQDKTKTERSDYAYDFRGQVSTITTYAQTNADGSGNTASGKSVTTFIYDAHGNLLQTIDARASVTVNPNNPQPLASTTGYATTYTYDGLGRLLTATQWVDASHSRTTVTQYDDANNRIKTTAANGLVTTQVFNRIGHLVSVAEGDASNTFGTTTYQYDSEGRLRITTDPTGRKTHNLNDDAGRIVATIDATGALTEIKYDAAGNAVKTIRYATRLISAQLASLVDSQGNPANVTLASLRPTTDQANNRVGYTLYDQANRAVMVISPHDTDTTRGYVTRNFYDGAGRLTDVVAYGTAISLTGLPELPTLEAVQITADANSDRHSRWFYDKDGRRIGGLDAEGYLTEYQYNATGKLTHTVGYAKVCTSPTRFTTDSFEALKSNIVNQGTSPDDQHSYAFYDAKGQQIGILDAENYLTEYAYDQAGNRTQERRYYAKANAYTGTQTVTQLRPSVQTGRGRMVFYDGANQVTSTLSTPDFSHTAYAYDNVGRLISTTVSVSSSDTRTTQARYDLQGRLTGELTGQGSLALENLLAQNPAATQTQINAIWASYGLTHSYDAAGRRTSTTDATGHKTLFYYDEVSRLRYTVTPADNGLPASDPFAIIDQGEVAEIQYNAFGEAKFTRRFAGRISTVGLTGGLVTDELTGRVADLAFLTTNSITRTNYTLRGAVKQAVDELGKTTDFTYTAFNQLETESIAFDATKTLVKYNSYSHRGFLIEVGELGYTQGVFTQWRRGFSREYDAFGRLTTELDSRNNLRTYQYDRLGRTVTTIDPLTHSQTSTYDAFGRVMTQTDALNHITTFTYNDGSPVSDGTSVTITTAEGISTTTYRNHLGETVKVTDGNGHATIYAYDHNGNLTGVTTASGELDLTTTSTYDHANLKLTTTDTKGTVTAFTYDASNRLLSRTVDPYDAATNPAGLDLTTTYAYDSQGRVITSTDANGTVTLTEYDAKGQVKTVTVDPTSYIAASGSTISNSNGLNLVTSYTYDNVGQTLSVIEAPGKAEQRTTQYVYDTLGRRIQEIQDPTGVNIITAYAYDANDNVVAKTEAQGKAEARTTRYVYDAVNRVTDTVDAMGGVTHSDYDNNGNLVRTIEYANPISLSGLGNMISASTLASRLSPNSPDNRVTQYAYDKDSRLVYTRDTLNQIVEREYDRAGNVIRVTAYEHAIPSTTANDVDAIALVLADSPQDQTTRTVYDAANRAVFQINGLNHVTEARYDGTGNVIRTIAYAQAITLPASLTTATLRTAVDAIANAATDRTTRTVYDAANRARYSIDAVGYVTETQYDNVGRIKQTTTYYTAVNTATLPAFLGEYETGQALTARINPQTDKDQITRYDYDGAGRLTSTTDAETHTEYYSYDAVGNKTSFTNKRGKYGGDPDYTWHYEYDATGRLTQETTPQVSVTRIQTDANGNPLRDATGQVMTVTTNESVVTRITYDALGNVRTRTEGIGLREDGSEVMQDARTTTYAYDVLGRQTQTDYPSVRVYDPAVDNLGNAGVVITQSENVVNNAWRRDEATNTLVTAAGVSIDISQYRNADGTPKYFGDTTPTLVKATVYRSDGTLVGTTLTEVGYATLFLEPILYQWHPVANWNGQVNISSGTLPPDQYRVELEVRNDACLGFTEAAPDGNYYYNPNTSTAVRWQHTDTLFINIGTSSSVSRTETTQSLSTTTQYDRFGNATVNRDASGNYSYKVYDVVGRIKYEIDADDADHADHYVTEYGYDSFGNQTTVTRHATPLNFSAHTNAATPFSADEVANLLAAQTASQRAGDRTLTNVYDRLNRIIETRQPQVYSYDSGSPTNPYFSASPTTRNEYNAFGQLTKQRTLLNTNNSSDSGAWSWADAYSMYDQRGLKTADVNAAGYLTLYTYDATGNLTEQTEYANPWSSQANPENRTTKYVYDHLNRKTQEIKVNVQYALPSNSTATPTMVFGNVTTSYGYDAVGYLVSITDNNEATTYTYYDALGRTTAIAEPARLSVNTDGSSVAAPAIFVQNTTVTSTTSSYSYPNSRHFKNRGYMMATSQSATLSWPSLASFGEGSMRVTVSYQRADGSTGTYSQDVGAPQCLAGTTLSWTEYGNTWNVSPSGITAVLSVEVKKTINGQSVVVLNEAGNSGSRAELLWQRATIPNAVAAMKVRAAGTVGDWNNVASVPLLDRGGNYGVDISSWPAGQYDYQLTYTLPGAPSAYYTGNGTFTVPDATRGFVDTASVSVGTVTSSAYYSDTDGTWAGTNSIPLKWNSMADWGSGDIRVTVGYSAANYYGTTTTLSASQTFSESAADTGATISWAASSNDPASNQIARSVTSVTIEKYVNGAWITVYSQAGAGAQPNRLILQGNVTGVSGIVIDGRAGTFGTTSAGGGALAVDVSMLARGSYTYHLIRNGVTETKARTFEVQSGTVSGPTVVQEIYGYKDPSGSFVRRLDIASLPTGTTSVTLEYWRPGDTGPHLSKTSTTVINGAFVFSYDDIANGSYQYQLTAKQANTILAIGNGGTGTLTIKRGAQGVATQSQVSQGTTFIPLAQFDHDIFGNVVEQSRYANGTNSAGELGFEKPILSVQDEHRFTQYDSIGHALQNIDGEGKNIFYSYNAAGQVAKSWQLQTNADGIGHYVVKRYDYDGSGHQIATTEVLSDGTQVRTEVQYDAFGSIAKKGTNGAWQEKYEYDNAGRLWRTNRGDGVTRVYLYNMQGQATAEIESPVLDLASAAYTTPTSVAVLTNGVSRTNTVYDILGHVQSQTKLGGAPDNTQLQVQQMYVNVGQIDNTVANQTSVRLDWSSLADWGDGDVTVSIGYHPLNAPNTTVLAAQTFHGMDAVTGATVTWTPTQAQSIASVRVTKRVNGEDVTLFDEPGSAYRELVFFQKPDSPDLRAQFSYQAHGASSWTTAVVADRGASSAAIVDNLPADVYDYKVVYQRVSTGENVGGYTGTFAVTGKTATASQNIVATVEERSVNVANASSDSNHNITAQLQWASLANWGDGPTTVVVTYMVGTTPTIKTFTSLSGLSTMTGATLNWVDTGVPAGSVNITHVTLKKQVNGADIVLFDRNTTIFGSQPVSVLQASSIGHNITAQLQYNNPQGDYPGANVEVQYTVGTTTVTKAFGFVAFSGSVIENIRLSWTDNNVPDGSVSITNVKMTFGIAPLFNGSPTTATVSPERLMVQGKTAGLTGITVALASSPGTVVAQYVLANSTLVSLGGGLFAADVSGLARGEYILTTIGTSQAFSQSFSVTGAGGTPAGKIAVRERSGYVDVVNVSGMEKFGVKTMEVRWADLSGLGDGKVTVKVNVSAHVTINSTDYPYDITREYSAVQAMSGVIIQSDYDTEPTYGGWPVSSINRISVWKNIDGKDVLIYDQTQEGAKRELEISSLPTTVASLKFQYRKPGDTNDWYLEETAGKLADGWFAVDLSRIPAGAIEYRLMALNASGQPVDLTGVGGATDGTYVSQLTVRQNGAVSPRDDASLGIATKTSQTVDRWGNVRTVTDPRNAAWVTTARYNYLNQVIEQDQPAVTVSEAYNVGADEYRVDTKEQTPITRYYYDALGRQIATKDANNHVNAMQYDEAGQVVAEIHADGAVVHNTYDALGRKIAVVDDAGNKTNYVYDRNNRLVQQTDMLNETTRYAYDELGNRISVISANADEVQSFDLFWESAIRRNLGLVDSTGKALTAAQLSAAQKQQIVAAFTTKMFYNTRGQLTKTRLPGNQESYSYYDIWGHKIKDAHSGTTDFTSWTYDYFGKLTGHTDLGGANYYQYRYDRENRLLNQKNDRGQNLAYAYHANGQMARIVDQGIATGNLQASLGATWYGYDAAGHRSREGHMAFDSAAGRYVTYENTNTTYDALGRASRYVDSRPQVTYDSFGRVVAYIDNGAQIDYSYDAVGNRRQINAYYYQPGTRNGAIGTVARWVSKNQWYFYDAMNRISLSQGTRDDATGTIGLKPGQGIALQYDGAGHRSVAKYLDPTTGNPVTEYYTYDDAGRFRNTYRKDAQENPLFTSKRTYDAEGRMVKYISYDPNAPGSATNTQINNYNTNGWLLTQKNYSGEFDPDNLATAGTNPISTIDYGNTYDSSGQQISGYAPDGRVLGYRVITAGYTNTYSTTYRTFESYKESVVNGSSTYFQSGNTNFTYDVNGNLVKVTDATDATRIRTFINNAQGEILRKTDWQKNIQNFFYSTGQPIGSTSADGSDAGANFDYNYTPVSDSYPATSPSQYTVNAGDTLQSVALAVYGDAQLWYLIADANGLAGSSPLAAGQTLTIPNKITNIHNDYQTFKPYNPGEIIGDTTPNLPDPPPPPQKKGGGCGVLGMIIMIVVAIVVTIFTAGAALAAIAPMGGTGVGLMAGGAAVLTGGAGLTAGVGFAIGAVAGAAGSIASQLVGMATGNVQEFSWGAVATSALAAGVTAGVGSLAGQGGVAGAVGISNKVVAAGINNAAGNLVNQGVNILTGQQKRFDWKSVAMAGASGTLQATFDIGAEKLSGGINRTFGLDSDGVAATVIKDGLGNLSGQAANVLTQRAFDKKSKATIDLSAVLASSAKSYMNNDKAKWGINGMTSKYGDFMDGLTGWETGSAKSNILRDVTKGYLTDGVNLLLDNRKELDWSKATKDLLGGSLQTFGKSYVANKPTRADDWAEGLVGFFSWMIPDKYEGQLAKWAATGIRGFGQSETLTAQLAHRREQMEAGSPSIKPPLWPLVQLGADIPKPSQSVGFPDWMTNIPDFFSAAGSQALGQLKDRVNIGAMIHGGLRIPNDKETWGGAIGNSILGGFQKQYEDLLRFGAARKPIA